MKKILSSGLRSHTSARVQVATKKNKSQDLVVKKGLPFFAIAIFTALFAISLWALLHYKNYSADSIIVKEVQKLQKIFKQIDQDCKIMNFEHTKNHIDFLTVKEFVGSQVGSMNLMYPRNWKGPYLQKTPTVYEQQYVILKTKKGYYLVPGDGVELANGKIVGKDLILDETSDIEKLLHQNDALKSLQGALAVKITVSHKNTLLQEFEKHMNYLHD